LKKVRYSIEVGCLLVSVVQFFIASWSFTEIASAFCAKLSEAMLVIVLERPVAGISSKIANDVAAKSMRKYFLECCSDTRQNLQSFDKKGAAASTSPSY
jgi:hypothetical protein